MSAPHPPLELLARGLHATAPVPLPFMAGVELRSFVLEAEQGPVIVYNTAGLDTAADAVQTLGQPRRLLINHWHEGMGGAPAMHVPTFVHARDRDRLEHSMPVHGLFEQAQRIGDDLEVIPSLAHTAGATFYLWDSGEHRYLFVGDSFWIEDGDLRAVILGESDRAAFLDTLSLMEDLDFDVLAPWPAQRDRPALTPLTPSEKQRQINALRTRVARGATGPSS